MGKSIFVNSFGRGRILDEAGNRILLRTKKSYELFFYLFQERNELITKEDLINTIFPEMDEEKAGNNLHTTIYQIRKSFSDYGYEEVIVYKSGTYFLNVAIISDLDEVNSLLNSELTEETLVSLLNIYNGKYFEKDSYPWSEFICEDIHTKALMTIKQAIDSGNVSNTVVMRFFSVFKSDCLNDLDLLSIVLDRFYVNKDYVKIKKIINEVTKHWECNFSQTLPENFLERYF